MAVCNIIPPTDARVTTLKQLPEFQTAMHADVNEMAALLKSIPRQPRGQLEHADQSSTRAGLRDRKEEMQQTVPKSRELDVPNQMEPEDHLTRAKRWLECNKAERERLGAETSFPGERVDSRPRLSEVPTQAEPEESLTDAKRWLEENKAERLRKKKAPPPIMLKFNEVPSHASLKRSIDHEVDKFAKYWEALRNQRELQSSLRWAGSSSFPKMKRGGWEEPANMKVTWEVRNEAATLWKLGIEHMHGNTILRVN